MKIINIIDGFKCGGIEKLAYEIISNSPADVTNFILSTDSGKVDLIKDFFELRNNNIVKDIYQWKKNDRFLLALRTFFLCLKIKPDGIIIYPCNRRMLWLSFGAKLAGIKKIAVAVQNTAPTNKKLLDKTIILLKLFNRLDILLVPCTNSIVKSFRKYSNEINFTDVIRNCCNTKSIRSIARESKSERDINDFKRIIMIARLDPIKDQETLLEAFAELNINRWELIIIGDGPNRIYLEKKALSLGLDPKSIFLGQCLNIPYHLGRSDIFAFSTTSAEGFGIVLIEALAAGLPIIASDVPACREVLFNGIAGELVASGDKDAWRIQLEELIQSSKKRDDLSVRSYEYALAYDSTIISKTWVDMLRI